MPGLDQLEIAYVLGAFLFQLILIIHFVLRKWRFDLAIRYGSLVYALSLPAAILSIILLRAGIGWEFWASGFIYLAWAMFGYTVEYIFQIEWRNSLRWSIFVPYVMLYLATVMFYWWPLARVYKPLWYGSAVLFVASTYLNVTSHKTSAPSSSLHDARRSIFG